MYCLKNKSIGDKVAKTFEYKIKILESHLDTFGHVNNAKYLELYEEARWDFITQNGYGLDKIQQTGIGPVILDIHITFNKEIKNRETITIVSTLAEEEKIGKIHKIHQEMIKENGDVASTIELMIGVFDTKARKLIKPTEDWVKAVGAD